jgi:hypothetical protein
MGLRPEISTVRELGHHQALYDWGIQFFNLPSLLTGFTSADLNTRCQSANIPVMSIEEIPINLRGHKVFQHGIVNYGNTLDLTLYETQDSKVQDFLKAYMNMQWTPITGSQVPKSLNQCCFLLSLLNSENEQTYQYTIIGAWLKGYEASGSLGSDSQVLSWSTHWQFDYWI